jgi:phage-related holin
MNLFLETKFKLMLMLSIPLSFITQLFETYVFDDWQFFASLSVLVALDTLTGIVVHFRKKDLSSSAFARLFTKVLIYACVLILTHSLKQFTVDGQTNVVFSWIDSVMYSAIMAREAISILENIGEIQPGIVPKWILVRLKKFDETGEVNNEQK